MSSYKNITSSVKTIPNNDVEETANSILQSSDWTQLPDSGLTDDCVALFKTYRASIRTIRKTNPSNPSWPDAPKEEWKS